MSRGLVALSWAFSCFVLATTRETCEEAQLPSSTYKSSSSLLQLRVADGRKTDEKARFIPTSDYCIEPFANTKTSAFLFTLAGMICIVGVSGVLLMGVRASAGAQTASKTVSKNRLHMPVLDGLRVLLVAYIIIYHTAMSVSYERPIPDWTCNDSVAHASMHFFFVVTGFLSCMSQTSAGTSFELRSGTIWIVSRLLRLAPAFYACILGTLSLRPGTIKGLWVAWPVASVFANSAIFWQCGLPFDAETNFLPWQTCLPGWFVADLVIATLFVPIAHNLTHRRGPIASGSLLVLVLFIRSTRAIVETLVADPMVRNLVSTYGGNYLSPTYRSLEVFAGLLSMQIVNFLPLKWNGWGWVFDGALVAAVAIVMAISPLEFPERCGDFLITGVMAVMCIAAASASQKDAESEKSNSVDSGSGIAYRILCWLSTRKTTIWLASYSYQALMLQQLVQPILQPWVLQQMSSGSFIALVLVTSWAGGAIFAQMIEAPLQRQLKPYLC